jgi:membrane protein
MGKCIRFYKAFRKRLKDDDVTALAAQITYFFILSFFPFLLLLITLVGYIPVTGEGSLEGFYRILPEDVYKFIVEVIREVSDSGSRGLLSFGMITVLWASSSGASALIKVINKAYDKKETRVFWKVKAVSLLSTVMLAGIIILTLVLLVFGELIGKYLSEYLGISNVFVLAWKIARYLIAVFSLFIVFFLVYYYMPCKRLTIKEVIPGAIFSTVSWIIISVVFSFYINSFRIYSLIYGSVGGIIVLLVWFYISSMIMIIGGEINAVTAYDKHN